MTVAIHTGKADFSALLGNGVRAALHGRAASVKALFQTPGVDNRRCTATLWPEC
jgi:hypothetical protein